MKKPLKRTLKIPMYACPDYSVGTDTVSPQSSSTCFNFDTQHGHLEDLPGIKILKTPNRNAAYMRPELNGFKNAFLYRRFDTEKNDYEYTLFSQANSGNLYWMPYDNGTDKFTMAPAAPKGDIVCALNYRYNDKDVFLMASTGKKLLIADHKTITAVQNIPPITSMCLHSERVFLTCDDERNSLWFSDDFDPSNWNVSLTEAGFIHFEDDGGKVIKAVSFLNYVYIFREYSIYRLFATGEQSDFSLTKLFMSTGKIYPKSITLAGDRIIFLAEDGFYAFDGANCVRTLKNVRLDGKKEDVVSAYHEGNVYIACKINYPLNQAVGCEMSPVDELYVNNTVVIYNPKSGHSNFIRGYDVYYFLPISYPQSTLGLILRNGSWISQIARENESYEKMTRGWSSGMTDLNLPGYIKKIRYITLQTNCDCRVGIVSDTDNVRTVSVKGDQYKSVRVKVDIDCSRFALFISTEAERCDIGPCMAEIDCFRRAY